MSSTARYSALTDAQLLQIDEICRTFERDLRNGETRSIETEIAQVSADLQSALFDELLELELEWRLSSKEPVVAKEYLDRFPQFPAKIRSCFAELCEGDGPLDVDPPKRIGRYRIEQLLGSGGFAHVYLATDEQLKRKVAVKVPHSDLVARREFALTYLREAQTVANLDHPNIVPVHDVGRTDEVPCFVVSKHIEGTDLAKSLKLQKPTWRKTTEIVADVADALHYAHTQGFVHRDVKPANVLLDSNEKAHLADFGVAIGETDAGVQKFVGTPAYMSPEQARGEGHRVDGRSDIYSLGAVLYEMLTGRRTFPKQSRSEVLAQIIRAEPKPPRQIDDTIPKELERICLKALSKRTRDRYTTALDMAVELRGFLQTANETTSSLSASGAIRQTSMFAGQRYVTDSDSYPSSTAPLRVVPRGLRSYDHNDASFFLKLLPGPSDRHGVPESVGFWRTRIEEFEVEQTFDIGLIYGPSGCGKSSLVKAGLLPLLAPNVFVVFVEATADQTESRILSGLYKHFADVLDPGLELVEAMSALRRHRTLSGKKVLIVLDQFEQWLHAQDQDSGHKLRDALRQCDGSRIQCIIQVRDDFWLAISRFMQDVEVDLVAGKNVALVDLFDPKHAQRVLRSFGRAFGQMPEANSEVTPEQKQFLRKSIRELAVDGKIFPIRLSLFAEMLKHKPWVSETLWSVGGIEGVGVTFLDETFARSGANPKHRMHQEPARAVLRALLPQSDVNIKGHMQSYDELLDVSGYENRPGDFDDLIRVLDGELRLITPIDETQPDCQKKSYQLTHDYLVPSLREWLTRKQAETRRGRAELRLVERSSHWNVKPESRFLPSLWEWLSIHVLTRKPRWTDEQHRLMGAANKYYGMRSLISIAMVALLAFMVQWMVGSARHRALVGRVETAVDTLANSRGATIPHAIDDLAEYPQTLVAPVLRQRFDSESGSPRLPIAFALARFDTVDSKYLVDQIATLPAEEVANLTLALQSNAAEVTPQLSLLASQCDAKNEWTYKHKLAITNLHLGDPTIAAEMCELRGDRLQRLKFIEGCRKYIGDLAELPRVVQATRDPDLKSAICVGVGLIPEEYVQENVKASWSPILAAWFNVPHRGLHSASEWLMKKWELPIPDLATTNSDTSEWQTLPTGMTMIRIAPGSFKRRHGKHARSPISKDYMRMPVKEVAITRPFLMSAREVTMGQYQRMMNDPDYPAKEKPSQTEKLSVRTPSADHPIHYVNWNDAVKYCNWMCRQEGYPASYERTGHVWSIPTGKFEEWRLVDRPEGYRLPTEAEWEYACRAGMSTLSPLGDEVNQMILSIFIGDRTNLVHASGSSFRPSAAGHSPPNAWGLFEMNGNVREWCHDWYASHVDSYLDRENVHHELDMVDPMGPPINNGLLHRVYRDGIFFSTGLPFSARQDYLGFRVVRSL